MHWELGVFFFKMYKSIFIYFLWSKRKYCLLDYLISIFLLEKGNAPWFPPVRWSQIFLWMPFSLLSFFVCLFPSKNLFIICFPTFCPTEFLFHCYFDSFPSFWIIFFQFVIVPSSLNQLPMLLFAYRITRSMLRCVMPIVFGVLCPQLGKGLPLLSCEGRACWRCDLSRCSHLGGARATARNYTQVSSASRHVPCALAKQVFSSSILCRAHYFFFVSFSASLYLAVFSSFVFPPL